MYLSSSPLAGFGFGYPMGAPQWAVDRNPNVPYHPHDRHQLAMAEYATGATRSISDSPMLDDSRAHTHERMYGFAPPSPRNLYERGTAASDAKSIKVSQILESQQRI